MFASLSIKVSGDRDGNGFNPPKRSFHSCHGGIQYLSIYSQTNLGTLKNYYIAYKKHIKLRRDDQGISAPYPPCRHHDVPIFSQFKTPPDHDPLSTMMHSPISTHT